MDGLRKCMQYVYWLSLVIIVGIFATDWFFTRDGDLLNDTIVGILIGAPIGWFGAIIGFFTTDKVQEFVNNNKQGKS